MKRLPLFISIFFFINSIKAQNDTAFNFEFNHQALSVKDVNISADFYKRVLQLNEITNRTAKAGIRWFSLGGDKELHLISTSKDPVTVNRSVHLALTTKNLDVFIKRLDELKIPYTNSDGKSQTVSIRADGIKQIYLQDPDGYWIEVNNVYASAPSVEQIKNEVWQQEENYWKYVKANDLTSYRALWDEQFIGYPSDNNIAGKDHITDWITDMYKDKSRKFSYELSRKLENVFDNIVIVLYDVTDIWTNDKNELLEKTTYKITHTWKKTDKGWLIIGGMGAKK